MQEIARIVAVGNNIGIGLLHSGTQRGMLDETVVDKQILLSARLPCILGFGHIAMNRHDVAFLVDRTQPFAVAGAIELADTLGKIACMQVVEQLAVAVEGIVDTVINQRHPFKDFLYMTQLNSIFFKEVTSCRNIEEKILHSDGSSVWTGACGLFFDF